MRTYVVLRHGSNAANQPMEPGPVPIGTVEASCRKVAEKRASERYGGKCYNNQYLTVTARPPRWMWERLTEEEAQP